MQSCFLAKMNSQIVYVWQNKNRGYYWGVSYSENEMTKDQGLTTNIREVADSRTTGIFVRDTACLHCDLMNENMPYLVLICLAYGTATKPIDCTISWHF